MFEKGVRYAVFSIRNQRSGTMWVRAGSAWVNRDGSMNLYLDVLPLDGTLHVREDKGGGPRTEPRNEQPQQQVGSEPNGRMTPEDYDAMMESEKHK